MKFLVYGVNGWIGSLVFDLLKKENLDVVAGNCRVNNIQELEKEIQNIQPTHVISLIGRTHGVYKETIFTTIDYLEQPGKLVENVRDNLFSPIVLSIFSKKYNFHFTYLGTGCIFEYDNEHPFAQEKNGFNEESLPNFFGSSYSIVKGFTDQLMHLFEDNVLNVRIRMPITHEFHHRNFITKITNYQKVCSIPNSMTVLNELMPIMIDMSKNKVTGTVNLTNPGLISHNEILEMYKEIVDPLFTWNNFSIEEQNEILASGRSNNFLDTTRLQTLYPNVKNIKESVKDMLHLMAMQKNLV
jgi:nucleoside-diphosphate-sugar epimerase